MMLKKIRLKTIFVCLSFSILCACNHNKKDVKNSSVVPVSGGSGLQFKIEPSEGGAIKAVINGKEVKNGAAFTKTDKVEFIVTPAAGYIISGWEGIQVDDIDSVSPYKAVLTKKETANVTAKLIPSPLAAVKYQDTADIRLNEEKIKFPARARMLNNGIIYFLFNGVDGVEKESDCTVSHNFTMGKYEVTYELWYTVRNWAEKFGFHFNNKGVEGSHGHNHHNPYVTENAPEVGAVPTSNKFQPVTYISWQDAIIWCNAYSQMAGLRPVYYSDDTFKDAIKFPEDSVLKALKIDNSADGYRLPTRAEWTFAARLRKDISNAACKRKKPAVSDTIWEPILDSTGNPIYYTAKVNGSTWYFNEGDSASGASLPAFPLSRTPKAVYDKGYYEKVRDETSRCAVFQTWYDGSIPCPDPDDEIRIVQFLPPVPSTAPVGTKSPNDLGCFDMSGNVYELTAEKVVMYGDVVEIGCVSSAWTDDISFMASGLWWKTDWGKIAHGYKQGIRIMRNLVK